MELSSGNDRRFPRTSSTYRRKSITTEQLQISCWHKTAKVYWVLLICQASSSLVPQTAETTLSRFRNFPIAPMFSLGKAGWLWVKLESLVLLGTIWNWRMTPTTIRNKIGGNNVQHYCTPLWHLTFCAITFSLLISPECCSWVAHSRFIAYVVKNLLKINEKHVERKSKVRTRSSMI